MNLRIKIPDHREKNALRKLRIEFVRVFRTTVGDFGPALVYGGEPTNCLDVRVIDGALDPRYRFLANGSAERIAGMDRHTFVIWDEAIGALLRDSIAACSFVRSQAEDVISHLSDMHRTWINRQGRPHPRRTDRHRRAA